MPPSGSSSKGSKAAPPPPGGALLKRQQMNDEARLRMLKLAFDCLAERKRHSRMCVSDKKGATKGATRQTRSNDACANPLMNAKVFAKLSVSEMQDHLDSEFLVRDGGTATSVQCCGMEQTAAPSRGTGSKNAVSRRCSTMVREEEGKLCHG